jgi:hypothetical protein
MENINRSPAVWPSIGEVTLFLERSLAVKSECPPYRKRQNAKDLIMMHILMKIRVTPSEGAITFGLWHHQVAETTSDSLL